MILPRERAVLRWDGMQALARDRVCVVGGGLTNGSVDRSVSSTFSFVATCCWNLFLSFGVQTLNVFFVLFDHEVFESFGAPQKQEQLVRGSSV
jgi:hypothetical protein